ncbi:MAG: restriction endonuclease subunit S [Akkermansiaceae bacterium]|nr:restriction endonuclease subunit S [Akkermansiaceae bacterium]
MTAYPNMKASGVSWVAAMPAHWEMKRMRESFSFRKGLSITKANLEARGIPVISYGQVHSKSNSGVGLCEKLLRFVNPSYLDTSANALVAKNDFIFADTSEDLAGCGNCAFIDSDKYPIFAGYHSVIAHPLLNGNIKYLAYLFQSESWRHQIREKVNAVKVYSITQKILKDIFLLLPPTDEQDQIVRFLDWKVSGINRLINIKKKEIARLGELKKTIVNEAVTHGINPNIPMKSSGVEWLGDIPEHWNTLKLKRISKERKEKQLYTPNTTDKYIGLENIKRDSEQLIITKSEYDKSIQNFCHKGDLLFGKLRPYLSKVIVCPYDSCCTNELLVLYSFAGNIHFLRYVMVSKSFIQIVDSSTYGAKMPRANTNYIMNMFVPLPPIEEQNLIVKYLNKQIGRIDSIIDRVIKQISLLQELKARLISDVATGQLDVRNIEVPKYEYVEENSDADPDSDDESEDVTDEED